MNTTEQNTLINEVLAKFRENLAALRACTLDDYILLFDNGLAIRFNAQGNPVACQIQDAEPVGTHDMPEEAWAYTPIVKNGAGEQAKVVQRQLAIKREAAALEGHIAYFESKLAEAA